MGHLVRVDSWNSYVELLEDNANTYKTEILSDKFKGDHDGYMKALGAYEAFTKALELPDLLIDQGTDAIIKLEKDYGTKA